MQHLWEFELEGQYNKLELFDSVLSARKKLLLNDKLVYDIMLECAFSYQFDLQKHHCQLIQMGDNYEFRIESQVFAHLLEIQKNKAHFQKTDKPLSKVHKVPSSVKRADSGSFFNNEIVHTPKEAPSPIFSFSIKSSNNNSNSNSRVSSATNSPLVPRKFDFNDIKVGQSPKTPANKGGSSKDLLYVSSDDLFSLDDSSPTTGKTTNADLLDFKKIETQAVLSKFASMSIRGNLFNNENFNNENIVYPSLEQEVKYPSFEEVVNNVNPDPFAQFL